MVRVLLDRFGGIFQAGLVDLLTEAGCDVVSGGPSDGRLLDRVVAAAPAVVVLNLDADGAEDEARELASRFPAVTVIACSSAQTSMRVYPPFHGGESYLSQLSPDLLVRASTGS